MAENVSPHSSVTYSLFSLLKNISVSVFLPLFCVICCFYELLIQSLRLASYVRTACGSGGQGRASPMTATAGGKMSHYGAKLKYEWGCFAV